MTGPLHEFILPTYVCLNHTVMNKKVVASEDCLCKLSGSTILNGMKWAFAMGFHMVCIIFSPIFFRCLGHVVSEIRVKLRFSDSGVGARRLQNPSQYGLLRFPVLEQPSGKM